MHACVAVWTRTADFLSSRDATTFATNDNLRLESRWPSKARLRKKANAIIAESVTGHVREE